MSIEALIKKAYKYSSSDIQRIAKITKTQAIHWTQTGIITPLQDAHGRGSRRVYSWKNLIEMMICRELNKYNIGRSLMKDIMDMINEPGDGASWPIPIKKSVYLSYWDYLAANLRSGQHYLIIVGGRFEIVKKRRLMSVSANRTSCVIINIAALIDEATKG